MGVADGLVSLGASKASLLAAARLNRLRKAPKMYSSSLCASSRIALSACAALALLTGCDSRNPTAPNDSAPEKAHLETMVPSDGSAGLPTGMYSFFGSPGTSHPDDVSHVTPVEFGSVPDSIWVVISVDGTIQQAWNPNCDYAPPFWPCQTGSVLTAFGSTPWDGGPVKMWAKDGDYVDAVRLRGVGGAGNTTSAIGLHRFQWGGGSLVGRVDAQAKWAWDPNYGTGPFSYYLSGGYNVAVTPIQSPLGVTATDPLDSLGTRQYTVRPLWDLQWINPIDFPGQPPAGSIHWYWVPGDSVPEDPRMTEQYWEVGECVYQSVCSYASPGPGRMQASGYVETRLAEVRSRNVCEAPSDWDGEDEVAASTPADNCGPLTRRCPKTLAKVITAGIRVSGTIHIFQFEGPFTRASTTSVPGTYPVTPTVSQDGWWIAESGTITVNCYGFYIRHPRNSSWRLFIGHASYQSSDLHMVMGPSHPDFHNTPPE